MEITNLPVVYSQSRLWDIQSRWEKQIIISKCKSDVAGIKQLGLNNKTVNTMHRVI